jgi:hypothetical protein
MEFRQLQSPHEAIGIQEESPLKMEQGVARISSLVRQNTPEIEELGNGRPFFGKHPSSGGCESVVSVVGLQEEQAEASSVGLGILSLDVEEFSAGGWKILQVEEAKASLQSLLLML